MAAQITALPTPPSRQDPVNFNDRADAFLSALPAFATQANTLSTEVNTRADTVEASASAVLAATNIVKWVSGTTYANGAVVWSPINGLGYRRITASGSGTTDPSSDTTNYKQVNGTGDVSTSGNQTIAGTKTFSSAVYAPTFAISGSTYFGESASYAVASSTLGVAFAILGTSKVIVDSAALRPFVDNSTTCGSSATRWSTVYAATGTINTSDAREKTAVSEFNQNELNAAIALSKEIGTYKWLQAIDLKGDAARKHIGLTVQRAIEIMQQNNLDPFAYGFICYDEWTEKETLGYVQQAGNRYSFRTEELLLFVARGFEHRLSLLEQKQ